MKITIRLVDYLLCTRKIPKLEIIEDLALEEQEELIPF